MPNIEFILQARQHTNTKYSKTYVYLIYIQHGKWGLIQLHSKQNENKDIISIQRETTQLHQCNS